MLYVIIAKLAFLCLTLFFTLLLVYSTYTTPLRRNGDHYLLLGKSVYW